MWHNAMIVAVLSIRMRCKISKDVYSLWVAERSSHQQYLYWWPLWRSYCRRHWIKWKCPAQNWIDKIRMRSTLALAQRPIAQTNRPAVSLSLEIVLLPILHPYVAMVVSEVSFSISFSLFLFSASTQALFLILQDRNLCFLFYTNIISKLYDDDMMRVRYFATPTVDLKKIQFKQGDQSQTTVIKKKIL